MISHLISHPSVGFPVINIGIIKYLAAYINNSLKYGENIFAI